jgi:prevent-host-death family protein
MRRPDRPDDVEPLGELRAHVAALIGKVRQTKRALVLTRHGRSAAVVVDVGEYERMVCELELLRDIHTAEGQLAKGEAVPHAEALTRVLATLRS